MAELFPLFKLHYDEISANHDIALDPDVPKYVAAEQINMLRVFVAREESGLAIGYAFFFLNFNMHYKGSYQAIQDVIFINPKKRGIGSKFIDWCDRQLQAEKVQVVYHHIKAAHNFGPLLERKGYKLVDLIYSKRLDKWL